MPAFISLSFSDCFVTSFYTTIKLLLCHSLVRFNRYATIARSDRNEAAAQRHCPLRSLRETLINSISRHAGTRICKYF